MKSYRIALRELLEAYKYLPCLWDQTDKRYKNKKAREKAYNILMEKYKVIGGPNATIEGLKKKIDHLRCTYRREYRKVQESLQKGDREYVPHLWHYHLLSFLNDKRQLSQPELQSKLRRQSLTSENNTDDEDEEFIGEEESQLDTSSQMCDQKPLQKKDQLDTVYFKDSNDDEDALQGIQDNYHLLNETISEPEAFGRTIGLQLKEINGIQRTIAEKLISEIIFYGRLNKLQIETSVYLNNFQ